jgi:hypothetical protein
LASLDGYVADEAGNFDWAAPGEDVHRFINELESSVGTYLFGRKLYEVMSVWQNMPDIEQEPGVISEYAAIWKSANKTVSPRRSQPSPRQRPGSSAASTRRVCAPWSTTKSRTCP